MNLQTEVYAMIERETERHAKLFAEIRLPLPITGYRKPLEAFYPPATENDLRSFTTKFGFSLPDDLSSWLLRHSGACFGRGCWFGVNAADPRLSVEEIYAFYSDWPRLRWFPLASDGCGNYYVQVIRSAPPHPIAFIDTIHDPNAVAYCVASGVWQFLWFSLAEAESCVAHRATQSYTPSFWWPFDRRRVLEVDPAIELISDLPLPWSPEVE